MDKKKKELIKNTIILFIGKTSTQLISFFLLPLYTAYLSTKEYGIVDLIQTYVTLFVPIISIQSGMSVFRRVSDVFAEMGLMLHWQICSCGRP